MKITRSEIFLIFSIYLYLFAIAAGAIHYLPRQIYAPGIFKEYIFNEFTPVYFFAVAIIAAKIIPHDFRKPSDWYIFVLNVFLLFPSMVLGYGTTIIDESEKFLILAFLLIVFLMLKSLGGGIKNTNFFEAIRVNEKFFLGVGFFWFLLLVLLILKYQSLMKFSALDSIYEQRELTSDVGGLWGYIQLYFSRVLSTAMLAYGLTAGRWRYFVIGVGGYFITYLITAEKSAMIYPIILTAVFFVAKKNIKPVYLTTRVLLFLSAIIYLTVMLSEDNKFFDLIGFFLFARVLSTPSQFIFDYYNFFSEAGYTYFSHIRVFDFFMPLPDYAMGHPKWPQLGWIVAENVHGIASNSNATFLASDGIASVGVLGMLPIMAILILYIKLIDNMSWKFPKEFLAVIFFQQSFILISASLFSILLSFGGLLILAAMAFYSPKLKNHTEV